MRFATKNYMLGATALSMIVGVLLMGLTLCGDYKAAAQTESGQKLFYKTSANNGPAPRRIVLHYFDSKPDYANLQANSVRVDVGCGCGTGVLVTRRVYNANRTYVWTAGHVVVLLRNADGSFNKATIYQEQRFNGRVLGEVKTKARVIAYSAPEEGEDLALLEILQDDFPAMGASFLLDTGPVAVGTELVHVGCTLGLYNSVSLGIMSQTDRDILKTGRVFDQTSVMGYPGSSGGGVYLKDGRCIGLLTRGVGPGLNFIVPIRRMLPWAKKMGIEWALDPRVPVPLTRAETPLDLDEPSPTLADPIGEASRMLPRPKVVPFGSR